MSELPIVALRSDCKHHYQIPYPDLELCNIYPSQGYEDNSTKRRSRGSVYIVVFPRYGQECYKRRMRKGSGHHRVTLVRWHFRTKTARGY